MQNHKEYACKLFVCHTEIHFLADILYLQLLSSKVLRMSVYIEYSPLVGETLLSTLWISAQMLFKLHLKNLNPRNYGKFCDTVVKHF
jgi:hypothetical protein